MAAVAIRGVYRRHLTRVSLIPQIRRFASAASDYNPFTGAGGPDESFHSEMELTIREAIQQITQQFPDKYWSECEKMERYPHELHKALTESGYLGIAIPVEYGGSGLGIAAATVMMQTIAESGAGIAGAQSIHANVYPLQPVVKFASEEQKKKWLPALLEGRDRSCFGVTEPNTGLDTLRLKTSAVKNGDNYIVDGQKIWISSAQVATRILLLARTTPLDQVKSRSQGLSLFYTPISTDSSTVSIRRIPKMGGSAVDANEIFFSDHVVPESDLIGAKDQGFKMILHGMNAERCLLAGEALGIGYAALRRAVKYASERVVFGRAIGKNQGIQHPLAAAWMNLEAAKLLTYNAARFYDRLNTGEEPEEKQGSLGGQCNAAKYLAAEASYKACETAVMCHGGMGYSKEYHVERYFRECLVPRLAPVSREMVLNYVGERVLGLPKSY